jgi:hypothetical protein
VSQVVEHLPNKCETLSSNSSTTKRKQRKTKENVLHPNPWRISYVVYDQILDIYDLSQTVSWEKQTIYFWIEEMSKMMSQEKNLKIGLY